MMRFRLIRAVSVTAMLALGSMSALAGETINYTGSATFRAHKLTMSMSNGDLVFGANNEGIVAISTEPPTLMTMRCMGLGVLKPDDSYTTEAYCTFRANANDAFDIRGTAGPAGGTGEIIGGTGRWEGATGTITMRRVGESESGGAVEFEIEMTTP